MDIRKLQRAIVDGLDDVKAQNTVVFNTEALSPLFERVIIASGTSNRQTRALAASVRDAVKALGAPPPRTEGEDNGEWIIVDCGAAVVHVMQPAIRDYYRLEEIWGGKPVVLKSQSRTRAGLPKASEPPQAPAPASAPKAAPRRKVAVAADSAPAAQGARPARSGSPAGGGGSSAKAAASAKGNAPRKTAAVKAPAGDAAAASPTPRRDAARPAAARRRAAAVAPAAAGQAAARAPAASARRAPSAKTPTGRTVVAKSGTATKTAAAPRRPRRSSGGA